GRDVLAHQADEEARGGHREGQCCGHGQRGRERGGDGERRADAEDLKRDRIAVDDREKDVPEAGAHGYALPSRKLARNGPKPSAPSQKRTRLETPMEERVAPVMPSISYSLPAAPRTTPMRISPLSSAI